MTAEALFYNDTITVAIITKHSIMYVTMLILQVDYSSHQILLISMFDFYYR